MEKEKRFNEGDVVRIKATTKIGVVTYAEKQYAGDYLYHIRVLLETQWSMAFVVLQCRDWELEPSEDV